MNLNFFCFFGKINIPKPQTLRRSVPIVGNFTKNMYIVKYLI